MTASPQDAGGTAPSGDPPLAGPRHDPGNPTETSHLPAEAPGSAPRSWFLADAAATAALGGELAALLPPGATLLLHGHLGAGKTTLVQGLAAALGIREPVTSPTFALAQHYEGQLADGRPTALVHLDLYRLEDPASAAELFAQEEEEAAALGALLVVEWAERMPALPQPCWQLGLSLHSPEDPDAGRGASFRPPPSHQ
jgi:tRNA threonylcarbamoyladenosine biosynthesis protein TsaE